MSFPLSLLAALVLIGIAVLLMRFIAEAGAGRDLRQLQAKRRATPPHTYTAHDGSQGRWP